MDDTCAAMSAQAAVDPSPDELPLLEAKLAKRRLRAGVILRARLFLGEMPQLETRSGSRSIDEEDDLAPAERHREAGVGCPALASARRLGGPSVAAVA